MDDKEASATAKMEDYPTLSEAAISKKTPKCSKKESKKSLKAERMSLGQFLTKESTISDKNAFSNRKCTSSTIKKRAFATSSPMQPTQPCIIHDKQSYPPTRRSNNLEGIVEISGDKKRAIYNFDIDHQPSGKLPTVDEVNDRVNHVRSSIIEEGNFVDTKSLCLRLCQYYKVRNVQELKCIDRAKGFFSERDIPAIKEFTMTANRILCIIQNYCTSSTVATLYDLERFICEIEKKQSFSDLKLGPLQKCPLIWCYFRCPTDEEIFKITPAEILQYLWHYGKEHKRIELEKFIENVVKRTSSKSPYQMGFFINSLPLAISITRKVKFGDYGKCKKAEEELMKNMEEDLRYHLEKLRRGLTGRNQNGIQTENVISRIDGMYIEDCIIEIFEFANKLRMQMQKKFFQWSSFLGGIPHILDAMTFFRSKPIWAKMFHVIVAKCAYRKIGINDYELLKMLGFQDSLKKIVDEQMLETFGFSDQTAVISKSKNLQGKRINGGELLETTINWLEKSAKPLDLRTLKIIELKIAEHFKVPSFGDLGFDSFLSYIQKEKVIPHLGNSIEVSAKENESMEINFIKDDIRIFVKQCGDDKSEGDICQSIRRQFKCTEKLSNRQILSLSTNGLVDRFDHSNVTFLHTMDCGDDSSFSNNEASDGHEASAMLGCYTREQAISCLNSAPLLENLAKWSCWDIAFAPDLGDLKSFLLKCQDICAIETPSNELLKISLDSTFDDLRIAIILSDPQETAGHVLSIIRANGNFDKSSVFLMAKTVRTSLEDRSEETSRRNGTMTTERFVLECMLHIPIQFCSSIVNKIFLTPLRDIIGNNYGEESIPARILCACKTTSERSYLHSLGSLLAIKEWKEDFEKSFLANNDYVEENRFVKNAVYKKLKVADKKEGVISKVFDHQVPNIEDEEEKKEEKKEDNHKEIAAACINPDPSKTQGRNNNEENSSEESDLTEELVDFEQDGEDQMSCEEETRINHCKDLIEKIRREEFGIGEETDEKGRARQRKNNERLCRALDRLSKELYTKDTHFVLELIQNADDNVYDDQLLEADSEEKPTVAFLIDEDRFTILNNEHGFEDKNIKAVCDIGKSTKGKHIKGYIGQKGIGFKSIFRVTDCPEIHSNDFHICFDAREDKMGYILPTWLNEYTDYTTYFPDDYNILLNWRTQLDLPLKKATMMSDNVRTVFQNIHPSLLLFLNRLKVLIIENKIDGKSIVMTKRSKSDNIIELSQNGSPSTWFVFSTEISIATRQEEETVTDVALAFPLDQIMDENQITHTLAPQPIHAFLPLRSYGFKFLIQADFEVPSSREDIDKDSPWNQEVLKSIPEVFVRSFDQFLNSLSNEGTIPPDALCRVITFFQFLPRESEIQGVFKPVARKILLKMRLEECIPVVKDGDTEPEADSSNVNWAKPSQVLLGDSLLRKIISPSELKSYLGWSYMANVMQQSVNSVLLESLGVHAESLDILSKLCISHVKILSEQKGKSEDTVRWIGHWLLCVSQFLERKYDSSNESLQKIKKLEVFPLSNGKMVSLTKKPVLFPFENTKTADYIRELEECLDSIDPKIYRDLDEIDALKLQRFLADLGVIRKSEKEVIDSFIMPCFKSGEWKEKEHLVVLFLIYLKEQYCLDENSVDIEELKECAVISTNHGKIKPTEKQIYFTPEFDDKVHDLRKYFPTVNWCLLSNEYLQRGKKTKDKSWQKFFRKLGVIDFPKMRKKPVSFLRSEMVDSYWAGLNTNWPSTDDGWYLIDDLVCPEFEEVLESRNNDQLLNLAKVLDNKWKSHFHQLKCIPVRDSNKKEIAISISSFLVKLQKKAWLLGDVGQNSRQLCKPEDLYLKTTTVFSILGEFGHYFVENLTEDTFIEAIKLKRSISLQTVFEKLSEWSRDDEFCTSVDHMINVYLFIQEGFSAVDQAELNIPLIFIPSEKRKSDEKGPGKFYRRGEVCFADSSGVMSARGKLLHNKRIILSRYYPESIRDFFVSYLKIDISPPIRDYMSIACALADETNLPDASACNDLMKIFSIIGRKCILREKEESFKELVLTCSDLGDGYRVLEQCKDNKIANFVYENLKEAKLLPTKRNKFVSINEKPLLSDNREYQEIYDKEDKVYFIGTSVMKSLFEGKLASLDSKQKGVEENHVPQRQKEFEILMFLRACRIDLISDVICDPDVIPDNANAGCVKWHSNLSALLKYIQRFIYTKDRDKYDMLMNENISEKLKQLMFFTSNYIETIYRMKKREDVNVKMSKNCCIQFLEKSIYLYISRDSLDESDDIVTEFLKIFYKENGNKAESLFDLLCRILPCLESASRIENILQKKDIPKLPHNEEVWQLREISRGISREISRGISREFEISRQLSNQPDPVEPKSIASAGLKCWPPMAHESSIGSLSSEKSMNINPLPPEWIEPAPPESFPSLASISYEVNDPQQQASKKDVSHSVKTGSDTAQMQVKEVAVEQVNVTRGASLSAEHAVGAPSNNTRTLIVNHEDNAFDPISQVHDFHHIIEKIPLEKIPPENISEEEVAQLIAHSSNTDTTAIGRYGERLVYQRLQQIYANQVKEGTAKVTWVNDYKETGQSFDIIVEEGKVGKDVECTFIEVKTTLDKNDKAFEMSSNELKCAFSKGQSYEVYRVGGIGNINTHWIKHLPGFARYLDCHAANILIALKD